MAVVTGVIPQGMPTGLPQLPSIGSSSFRACWMSGTLSALQAETASTRKPPLQLLVPLSRQSAVSYQNVVTLPELSCICTQARGMSDRPSASASGSSGNSRSGGSGQVMAVVDVSAASSAAVVFVGGIVVVSQVNFVLFRISREFRNRRHGSTVHVEPMLKSSRVVNGPKLW